MKTLILFDVDGTLCYSGQKIKPEMCQLLTKLKAHDLQLSIIGGGTYDKISNQLSILNIINVFDDLCAENAMDSYNIPTNKQIYQGNIRDQWDATKLTQIVTHLLEYTFKLTDLPVKTGKFIDLRKGLIYWSLIGQNCTYQERQAFKALDIDGQYRIKVIKELQNQYPIFRSCELSLGGELGISISPEGFDKSYVKNVIDLTKYDKIYFFGDKLDSYGSDEAMKKLSQVKCYQVTDPDDSLQQLTQLFLSDN